MSHTDDHPPNLSDDEIEPIDRPADVVTPPPLPSPSLPSPVSLYRLGISPFARQFSSPCVAGTALQQSSPVDVGRSLNNQDQIDDGYDDEDTHDRGNEGDEESNADHFGDSALEQDPLTLDSRDVLLQRLGDLMQRLGGNHDSFRDENLSALHTKVDEMEEVLKGTEYRAQHRPWRRKHQHSSRPLSLDFDSPSTRDTQILWGSAPSPSALLRSQFSDLTMALQEATLSEPQDPAKAEPEKAKKAIITPEDANRIVKEAEELNEHLTSLISRLQARQEESEHIHALLIDRAERAAQRIIVLEEHVQSLESEVREYDTELTSLRIALKAIEVQCPPAEIDEDLRRSIQNWRADWKNVKEKRASRLRRESSFLSSAPATPH
ncbi:hypothetical protein jhhlp_005528 [Lomentospora prolificans]|uniref:Uncharacterized protein n=1 Tax=Lomentospora prolificans TaxID=41688 RepID=A0A2N3N3E8_9PEZI|nr:hypothetical protein jhhlp_005528 [Lomentospora prolificans]